MAEGIELPEHEQNEGALHPLTIPVSVTISILAVLGAVVTLLGHRAHTEELLLQAKATDQWAYYQAKNIRLHEMQAVADMLNVLAPADKEKAAAVHEKYTKEVERYENDKDTISDKAKELEAERDLVSHRADRFDAGEVFLEMGLVICSITLLTKRRFFWFSGIAIGAVGVIVAITGLLLH
jgi:Domain of unknown function (DUF4337)